MTLKIRMIDHRRSAVTVALTFLFLFGPAGPVPADMPVQRGGSSTGLPQRTRFELSDAMLMDSAMKLEWPRSMTPDVGPLRWTMALGYVAQLNRDRFLGHDDWRLPSREEVLSLVEYVKRAGFDGSSANLSIADGLHAVGLQTVRGAGYWTATESWYNQGRAWTVDLSTGNDVAGEKSSAHHVIAVRSMP